MEIKLPKIEYNFTPAIKDVFIFLSWFVAFFLIMVAGSELYSFSSKSRSVSLASSALSVEIPAQNKIATKNPKIVKFEKVKASVILASSELNIATSTPTSTSSPIHQRKNINVVLRELKKPSPSPTLFSNQSEKKTLSTSAIARRKYVASDIFPTRIVISKIGVDTPISNPEWNDIPTLDEALKKGAVRYPQSGLLGEDANMLLFGHSSHLKVIYNKAYKSFNELGNLTQGDEITVYSNQKVYTYRVLTVELVKNSEESVGLVSNTPRLTLVTCNNFGAKEDRFVVVAELAGVASLP